MADEESIKWAEKSRQIEVEKMKAARALAEEKPEKANLAFLDPKTTKVKGWSADSDVILADGEKMGNRALIFALGGAVLDMIGALGAVVSETYKLGLAGVILAIPSGLGFLCMGLAVLMAIAAIVCEIYFKFKRGRKFSVAFWSSLGAILLVVVYYVIRWLIMTYS